MDVESYIISVIRGERKAPFLEPCLALLGWMYRGVIALKNFAYDLSILPSKKLDVPVISVGNIAAGGTGKTPLTHLLALRLQDNTQLAILSRGFRSQMEKAKVVRQISAGQGPECGPQECGDEPYFLAQKTRAQLWVGIDRVLSGQNAIEAGAKCLLLDDGMQHRRLKRDIEIVVVDGASPVSQGRFLPWGMLRDSPKRLKEARLIVASHVKDSAHFARLQSQLSLYSKAPIVGVQMRVVGRERLAFKKVGVFCAIGQPAHFLQTVRDLKSEIVDTLFLNDHRALQEDQLRMFARKCFDFGAEALLCTEKDYVKLDPDLSLCLNVVPVAAVLHVAFGEEHWECLVEDILNRVVT